MKIGDVIKKYRDEHGESQRSMAKKLGCSYAYIGMMENGINPKTNKPISPSLEIFQRMASLLHTDIDGLLMMLDDNQPITVPPFTNRHLDALGVIKIPVLGRVVAGDPQEAIQEADEFLYIPAMGHKRPEDYFALRVYGESMEPNLQDGDIAIVRIQPEIDSGQIAVVLIDNQDSTVKRVFISEEGITLVADNPAVFRPRFFSNEDCLTLPVQILGRVISIQREM